MINIPEYEDLGLSTLEAAKLLNMKVYQLNRLRKWGRAPTHITFDTGEIIYSYKSVIRARDGRSGPSHEDLGLD